VYEFEQTNMVETRFSTLA